MTDPWAEARRLVVSQGLGYNEAAALAGLSVSAVQKRAAKEGWQDERKRRSDYLKNLWALKPLLLKRITKALDTADGTAPQLIAQLRQLEQMVPEKTALDPGLRRAVAVEELERFLRWAVQVEPKLATGLSGLLERYGREQLDA